MENKSYSTYTGQDTTLDGRVFFQIIEHRNKLRQNLIVERIYRRTIERHHSQAAVRIFLDFNEPHGIAVRMHKDAGRYYERRFNDSIVIVRIPVLALSVTNMWGP